MYYLRSRYYDAYCARFVNADYLINTPTAFSCNGFCYCSNNPCNDIDTDGTFGNGTIHYEVCVDIVARNPGIYMNLTKVVPGRNGSFGLCDLVSDSGQIWEVKRVTCAPLLAVRQLNAYLSSTFQNRPGLIDEQAHLGKRAIAGRMFLSDSGYIVCYMDTGTGFILYDYSRPNLRSTPEEVTEKLRKRIESRAPKYAPVSAPVPVYASESEFSVDWNGILEWLAPVGGSLSLAVTGGCAFAMQEIFGENVSLRYRH